MSPSTQDGHAGWDAVSGLASLLRRPLEAIAFWAAIALPFLYLPLLSNGFAPNELLVFVGLLVLNGVSLIVGHGHGQ